MVGSVLRRFCKVKSGYPRLCHLHIMGIMAATHTDTPNHTLAGCDRVTSAKYDQAIRFDDAVQQWIVILHELEPVMGRHTKANSGIGFVLGNLQTQERRSIHAAELFEGAVPIANSDTHWSAHFAGFGFGGCNHTLGCFDGDARFLESVCCHRNIPFSSWSNLDCASLRGL